MREKLNNLKQKVINMVHIDGNIKEYINDMLRQNNYLQERHKKNKLTIKNQANEINFL